MRLRVVTDSSTNVPDEWLRRLNIIEVPAVVNFGEVSFLKHELTQPEFYRRLAAAPRPPTTAQPTPGQFGLAYQQAAAEGADEVVAVIVSGKLSGTYNSAVLGIEDSPIPVHAVDTRHASMAAGWLAIEAAEMVLQSAGVRAILERLARIGARMRMGFSPANLKYIIASGRVPRLRGAIGNLLDIKPIIMAVDGGLEPVAQVRSQRRALQTMMEMILGPFGDKPVRVAVGHCNVPEQVTAYREAIHAYANVVESMTFDLGVILAALGGPGLLGAAAYTPEE